MNFVGHITVLLSASRRETGGGRFALDDDVVSSDEAAVAFGAALPDLAAMAGVRLQPSGLPAKVQSGVALHHRTDTVFHAMPEFTAGASRLRERLQEAGLALGPSRAVGHAGWELLFDGCLLERRGVEAAFDAVLERAPDVAESVAASDPDRWRLLLARMRSDRWWTGYCDGEGVARSLERRLRARRRLSFSLAEVGPVADALAEAKPAVEMAVDRVMEEVTTALVRDGLLVR